MSPHHSDQMSQRSQVSKNRAIGRSLNVFVIVFVFVLILLSLSLSLPFFGRVMSPHHSDQMSQRSQVSRIAH